jgi:hypothetical protein
VITYSTTEIGLHRPRTTFNPYAFFSDSTSEEVFRPISNIDVWPARCLITSFHGKLLPDLAISSGTLVTGDSSRQYLQSGAQR